MIPGLALFVGTACVLSQAVPTAREGTSAEKRADGVTVVHNAGTYHWPGASFRPCRGEFWDFSNVGVIEVVVSNCCERNEMIFATVLGKDFSFDRSPAKGALTPPHEVRTISVQIADEAYVTDLPVKLTGMRGVIGSMAGKLDFSRVTSIDVYQTYDSNLRKSAFAVLDIRTRFAARRPQVVPAAGFFPFVDRYGQFRHGEWPGKIHSDAELRAAHEREDRWLSGEKASPIPDADAYGGWKGGPRLKATGYFRAEKRDGKWWLVDPDGYLFFSLGVTCVYADNSSPLSGRESYFEWLPPADVPGSWTDVGSGKAMFNFIVHNQFLTYGPGWERKFAETAHRRLRAWGFNTLGNWSERYVWEMHRTPYVATVDTHTRPVPDATDPKYEASIRKRIEPWSRLIRDDPWCVGVFVDNELDWMSVRDVFQA